MNTNMLLLASALSIAVSANAAFARGSYTGTYPLIITKSDHSDGTYCLTLTDAGGRSHSGSARLTGPLVGILPYGTFQVINHIIVASAEQQLGDGSTAGLIFTGPAADGNISKVVYDQDYGGFANDAGVVAIGEKNGC